MMWHVPYTIIISLAMRASRTTRLYSLSLPDLFFHLTMGPVMRLHGRGKPGGTRYHLTLQQKTTHASTDAAKEDNPEDNQL